MSTVPLRDPQTLALIAYLHTQTLLPIGDGEAPEDVGWVGAPGFSDFRGYGVVHPIQAGELDGDLARPSSDSDLIWQVNGIGGSRSHADQIADRFAEILLGPLPVAALQIPGRALRWIHADVPHGAARQDPDQPATWFSPARYRIATTPIT